MKKKIFTLCILIFVLISILSVAKFLSYREKTNINPEPQKSHWFILHRKSGKEFLYFGVVGDENHSRLVKTFQVKSGNPKSSPTPLPQLLGRKYWKIITKESSKDNPDTAPYFLRLDIPATGDWPYGPIPYKECADLVTGEKIQCDWVLPGYFGLHGVNGNDSKLSKEDPGSSGCIRHTDSDITYLYNILTPEKEEIRYYIKDI